MPAKKVALIMGSDSDLEAVAPAKKRLDSLGIPVEAHIFSAHRTPEAAAEFSKNARANGFGVIIAAAGKAAHLAGALAAHTTLPVIGIPVKSSTLDGLDALLSTVQMPSGVPVACVAINGAKNAAILAVQMMGTGNPTMRQKVASGVPVATVAIDGADNAALLAAQILSVEDGALAEKLQGLKEQMKQGAIDKDRALQTRKW